MTFNELYFYQDGVAERDANIFRAARLNAWAGIASQTKKKVKPQDVWQMPEDEWRKQSKRSGITKEEHLALVKKWSKHF